MRIDEGRRTHCSYSRINISHEPVSLITAQYYQLKKS